MKEIITAQGIESWSRAKTLTERLSSLRASTYASPSLNYERARQQLQRWKEQIPFNKEGFFARRLAADGLTEDQLVQLLAGEGEVTMIPETHWIEKLKHLSEQRHSSNNKKNILPLLTTGESGTGTALLEVLRPFLRDSLESLRSGMQSLSRQYGALPFEPEPIIAVLLKNAGMRLLPRMLKTVILELNVARVQERLRGETPEERFQDFLCYLNQGGIWSLLEEYPVLARLLVETIDLWLERSLELLQRLCADWEEIRATFLPAGQRDAGLLVDIEAGKGDFHRGSSSVTVLTWNSGFRLMYKPRSLNIDKHFHELLDWLNEQGYQPAFRSFKLIAQESYGWVEFIQGVPCASQSEIERFYQRQGGYLAVLYALGAVDFHAENLIAEGEYPMLIDLEALFHHRMTGLSTIMRSYPGQKALDHSVLSVGMLPQRQWSSGGASGVDYSGLGYQTGQLSPVLLPTLIEVGTDQMRIGRERGEVVMAGKPRPQLDGKDADVQLYRDSIVVGFTAAYQLLLRHRDVLLDSVLSRFAGDEIRCLLRPTQVYKMLLADTFHPDTLRNGLDRDRLLDRLWIGTDHQPYLERVIAAERADLYVGDVPVFTTHPDSHSLYTSDGQQIENFFTETGMAMVRARLARFSEQDLEKQAWIIRASFTSMVLGTDEPSSALLTLRPTNAEASRERLLDAACKLGDRLNTLALRGEDMVGWLGVTPVNEREWHLRSTELDLYSGNSGIALFLGYLGKLSGDDKYSELARLALNSVRYQAQIQVERGNPNISAFNGIGSFIYLLSHLGTLWHEPELYKEAAVLVEALPDFIAKDELFDVVNGAAGCISSLLSLHAVAPSISTLIAALQCGDHLLAHTKSCPIGIGWSTKLQEVPLTGFSHGSSGIALNLLRLFSVSGEDRFYQTALDALAYERSLFSAEQRNWPDLRTSARPGGTDRQAYMVAWCHGAPGIALARLGMLQLLDGQQTRAEIASALQTTIERGFGGNHSLCHGDMGNLDVLLSAASLLEEPYYEQQVKHYAAILLASIEEQGWITGVPQGVETPGLMTGLAGIGYTLLRLVAREQVPSVLLLDPPAPSC